MLSAHMVESAHYAALEQRKEALAGIDVRRAPVGIPPRKFISGVVYHVVPLEVPLQSDVNARLIRVDNRVFGGALGKAGSKILLRDARHNLGSSLAVALNERDERRFA